MLSFSNKYAVYRKGKRSRARKEKLDDVGIALLNWLRKATASKALTQGIIGDILLAKARELVPGAGFGENDPGLNMS